MLAPQTPASSGARADVSVPDSLLSGLVVPALLGGLPGIVLLGVVLAQLMGGVAMLPAIRRVLGSIGIRRVGNEA